MKTRTALIVVAATASLFVAGLVAVVLVGRTLQSIRSRVNNEFDRQTFVSRWQPPSLADGRSLLPERVLNRSTTNLTRSVKIPEFDLDLPGWSASYTAASTGDAIHVAALAPDAIASSNVFSLARAWYEKVPGTKQFMLVNDRIQLSTVEPPRAMEIWSLQGWTFLFSAPVDPGSDFIRACLEAAAAPPSIPPAAPRE